MKTVLGPGEDYIDHCIDIVGLIDAEELASQELNLLLGRSVSLDASSKTQTYYSGETMADNDSLHTALKLGGRPEQRFLVEARDISFLLSRVPEIFPKFPYFLGLVAVEGSESPAGVITEDATKGGEFTITETWLGGAVLRKIIDACPDIWIHEETLQLHTTFRIGTKVADYRILDLKPSIFNTPLTTFEDNKEFADLHEKAIVSADQATVVIPAESMLAESIRAKQP